MLYFIGMLGNLMFGVKSLFQIIKCYKSKSAKDLSIGMLFFDFGGKLLCAIFIFGTTGFILWPQFVNYALATLWLIVLFFMKFAYKENKTQKDST